jgi:hypothetical protein
MGYIRQLLYDDKFERFPPPYKIWSVSVKYCESKN